MKCAAKVLCPLFAAIGIWVGTMYIHGASPDTTANWMIFSYALIGFAVGAVITGILKCCSKGKCPVSKCDDETKSCDDKKSGCH
jgi:hypothetical protein